MSVGVFGHVRSPIEMTIIRGNEKIYKIPCSWAFFGHARIVLIFGVIWWPIKSATRDMSIGPYQKALHGQDTSTDDMSIDRCGHVNSTKNICGQNMSVSSKSSDLHKTGPKIDFKAQRYNHPRHLSRSERQVQPTFSASFLEPF